jgi:hypothetical protein
LKTYSLYVFKFAMRRRDAHTVTLLLYSDTDFFLGSVDVWYFNSHVLKLIIYVLIIIEIFNILLVSKTVCLISKSTVVTIIYYPL